jgi:hypothetical protein
MLRKTYWISACAAALMLGVSLAGMAEEAAGVLMQPGGTSTMGAVGSQ